MTTARDAIEALRRELSATRELLEAREVEPARRKYREIEAAMAEVGVESAYVLYCLAETYRGAPETTELEAGFELCCRVVRLDPIHPAHQEQFAEYGNALRQRLEVHSRRPREPHAPRLYETLQRAGETDAACHVALARYLAANERFGEAMKLLEATVLLDPGRGDAWQLMADTARKAGREADAARYEARRAELAGLDVPFGVPAPSAVC